MRPLDVLATALRVCRAERWNDSNTGELPCCRQSHDRNTTPTYHLTDIGEARRAMRELEPIDEVIVTERFNGWWVSVRYDSGQEEHHGPYLDEESAHQEAMLLSIPPDLHTGGDQHHAMRQV